MTLRPYSATLQAAYRDTLGTPGAPEVIDDSQPVTPVAVVAQVNTSSTASYTRVTDGTDNLEVEADGKIRTGLESPSSSQTVVNIAFTGTGAAQDAYTVTSGKTFYMHGIQAEEGSTLLVYKNDASTRVARLRSDASAANQSGQFTSTMPIWAYTSGQIVKVNGTNLKLFNIWGFEQ